MKRFFPKIRSHTWLLLVYLLAFGIRLGIAIPLMHDWDGFVFSESAKLMIHGITPYQTVQSNNPIIYPDSDRPMTEQWYGYPPIPLLMFTVPFYVSTLIHFPPAMVPMVENVAIKVPFMLGDLLCAFLVQRLLAKKNTSLARRAELLILFNPLLIWISAAWGMFDIWIINCIVLFLLAVRSKKAILAGIFLALAPQIKLFPLFFLPVLILFFFQTSTERKDRIRFMLAFVLTTLSIDIPFFLSSPQGFMNQNLIMHLSRPPQGIGIIGILDYLSYIYSMNISLFVSLGGVLTLGCVGIFNLFSLSYLKGRENRLLTLMLLIYTSILLFNKVVNEQYYVVLVGLLIILTHFPKREQTLFGRNLLVTFEFLATTIVLIASIVLGFHFLTFLPPFLADGFFKTSTNYLVFYFSRLIPQLPLYTYPNSLWTFYNIPVTLTYLLLLPLIFISGVIVFRGLVVVLLSRRKVFASIASLFTQIPVTRLRVAIVLEATLLIVLLSIPFAKYLTATKALTLVDLVPAASSQDATRRQPRPKVGIFYNVWWNNPSHLPNVADDAWSKTALTPLGGYYTSKNSYFVQHISEMKQAGIDFAVVSYHLYDRDRFLSFSRYAEKLQFTYAPMVESDDALSEVSFRPVTPDGNPTLGYKISDTSMHQMTNEILSSVVDVQHNQYLFRISNKPVVYVYDGHFYMPSWDMQSKIQLAKLIYAKYARISTNPYQSISTSWKTPITSLADIIKKYPSDIHSFNNSNKNTASISNDDYKQAFLLAYNSYWKDIKAQVEAKVGPIYLVSTYQTPLLFTGDSVLQPDDQTKFSAFDDEFYYSLSNTWSYWKNVNTPQTIMSVWEKQEADQAARDRAKGWPVFLTVNPTYKDTSVRGKLGFAIPATVNGVNIYQWTWQTAVQHKADYILIASWNEFFEGSAIEPSVEYGSYYLNATKSYAQSFKQPQVAQLH